MSRFGLFLESVVSSQNVARELLKALFGNATDRELDLRSYG